MNKEQPSLDKVIPNKTPIPRDPKDRREFFYELLDDGDQGQEAEYILQNMGVDLNSLSSWEDVDDESIEKVLNTIYDKFKKDPDDRNSHALKMFGLYDD